jgi:hypothetical protein
MTDRELLAELDEQVSSSRAPRKTREQSERPKVWQPASLLPEPDQQPGYVYRWIRVASAGKSDGQNLMSKRREGWEAVRIEEQPQFSDMVDPDSRYKDNIEVGGLLLCKAPKELMNQRKNYFAQKNQAQMDSVDNNFMRESDNRMPLFKEKRSTTSFGSGKR